MMQRFYRIIFRFIFAVMLLEIQAIAELSKSQRIVAELDELIQSIFIPDGKYVPIDSTSNSFSSLIIHSKYPYLMIRVEADPVKDQIHTVRPTSWPEDALSLLQKHSNFSLSSSSDHRVLQPRSFSVQMENVSFANPSIPNLRNIHYLSIHDSGQLLLQTSQWTNGTDKPVSTQTHFQRVKTNPLKDLIRHQLCSMDTLLLHGKWKLDYTKKVTDEEKWNTCPIYHQHFQDRDYDCPNGYHPARYSSSSCYLLPLTVSLRLLYHFYEKASLFKAYQQSINWKQNYMDFPYYTFIGDSLNGQVAQAGKCELENHHFLTLPPPSSPSPSSQQNNISFSSFPIAITINAMWNQYLRDDLPCHPQCLTNDTFIQTDGKRKKYDYLPAPCKGCPDGKQHLPVTSSERERLFAYLNNIPQETRILVLNGGAWYTEFFHVHNGSSLFRETLLLLLPYLAQLQQKRGYSLDIYFLTLPSFHSIDLGKNKLFEWEQYSVRNHIIQEVFSPVNLIRYNLTVMIIPNDKIFHKRKSKSDGQAISTPDLLHYCAPGVFSPPSVLFELILHFHLKKRLQSDGYVLKDS